MRTEIDIEQARHLLRQTKWLPMSAIVIYLLSIAIGRQVMYFRRPLRLKTALFIWNVFLATYSAIGFKIAAVEMSHTLALQGLRATICTQCTADETYNFWSLLFVLSKMAEMLDTAFLVLRKKPVPLLHYYHHVTVVIFGWWTSMSPLGYSRYIMSSNLLIHTIMYAYFAVKTINLLPVSKRVSMAITVAQIVQMVLGMAVGLYAMTQLVNGAKCDITWPNVALTLLFYGSYFLLFIKFFYNAYVRNAKRKVN